MLSALFSSLFSASKSIIGYPKTGCVAYRKFYDNIKTLTFMFVIISSRSILGDYGAIKLDLIIWLLGNYIIWAYSSHWNSCFCLTCCVIFRAFSKIHVSTNTINKIFQIIFINFTLLFRRTKIWWSSWIASTYTDFAAFLWKCWHFYKVKT